MNDDFLLRVSRLIVYFRHKIVSLRSLGQSDSLSTLGDSAAMFT